MLWLTDQRPARPTCYWEVPMKVLRVLPASLLLVLLIFVVHHFASNVSASAQMGSVSAAAPMLEPRSGHTATLLSDGRVLIVGGMRRNQDFYRSAEFFDPATGKF